MNWRKLVVLLNALLTISAGLLYIPFSPIYFLEFHNPLIYAWAFLSIVAGVLLITSLKVNNRVVYIFFLLFPFILNFLAFLAYAGAKYPLSYQLLHLLLLIFILLSISMIYIAKFKE